MQTTKFSELMAMGQSVYVIDETASTAELNAMLNRRAGDIIPCVGKRPPFAEAFIAEPEVLGCVAGWVSEDEPSTVDGSGSSHG